MLDPTSAYRTAQVVSASPIGQIVLLYQGAIRFGAQHLAWLEHHEPENRAGARWILLPKDYCIAALTGE